MIKSIDIINFDNSYLAQDFYKELNYRIIDLSKLKGVTYFCDRSTLNEIRTRVKELEIGNFKYFGSGNYHYMTYLILEKIKEPFSLILLDHHVEMLDSSYEDLISCGSWLLNVLEDNKYLKEVFLIGINSKYIEIIPKKYLKEKNIVLITEEEIKKNKDYLKKLRPRYNSYITIDKDVFKKDIARTNWDQGSMDLYNFKLIINSINTRILGVDICGEDDPKNQDIFNRNRLLSIEKNNKINNEIIKILV